MSISRIEINKFGTFEKQNNISFKRLNIIYGRNYSGKTTLSRIFRTLETGRIPNTYTDPSFTIHGDKGSVNQSGIHKHGYDVRVYNRDFVIDNLSFLVNQDKGVIKSFAIVGEKNKKIENEITEIEHQLVGTQSQTGLKHALEEKRIVRDNAQNSHKSKKDSLDEKLRRHANDIIKNNREYGEVRYDINSIKQDIDFIQKTNFKPLSDEENRAKSALLNQKILPTISTKIDISLGLVSLASVAKVLLQKSVTPSKPIQELLNDSILQMWVKDGIPLHKLNRNTCAFCRQTLPSDIWDVIDSHFNKESTDLESKIDASIISINLELKRIPTFITLNTQQFYSDEKASFEQEKNSLENNLAIYKQDLENLLSALQIRKNNLFKNVIFPIFKYDENLIETHSEAINDLIAKSNSRSKTLTTDKIEAKKTLRLSDIACFITTIDYNSEQTQIAKLKTDFESAKITFSDGEKEITRLENKVTELRKTQTDERKGADRINDFLNHFFGHDGIKLDVSNIHDKAAVKFQIIRNGVSAYNLSEGECSLIAFCYFIAKLEEQESKGKELIIYIDDPISSLDGNHIFFMFSLIESLIAKSIKKSDGTKQYRYKQLFISTHNLDFLKYLKKISLPNKTDGHHEYFMIERNQITSNILEMPSYLKCYITEFNYLFHQIYKCSNYDPLKQNHEIFYSFGNNLRKFLEAFLFYKYPYQGINNDERIRKFFGDDDTAIALANRINNELSHLETSFDRSNKPIEIPEISKLANYVLDKMYNSDPDQYNALLKSIGENERISSTSLTSS